MSNDHIAKDYRRGCRCTACKKTYMDQRRYVLRRNRNRKIPDNIIHGEASYVYWSCRCDVCREASRAAKERTRKQRRSHA
jgi:hypothetical protein